MITVEKQQVRYEIMPTDGIVDEFEKLPSGHPVAVTMSTTFGLSRTMDVVEALDSRGFEVLPHVAARMIPDRETLADVHDQLERSSISSVFIPGGDAETPAGPFESSYDLIRELNDDFAPSYDIGISGYPEGHEFIADDTLRESMLKKEDLADYIVSHICFTPSTITEWCDSLRQSGINLPVYCCVPTVMPVSKLQNISDMIGVGKSAHSIGGNSAPDVSGPDSTYRPTELLNELETTGQISGFHISTFNRLSTTREFHQSQIAR